LMSTSLLNMSTTPLKDGRNSALLKEKITKNQPNFGCLLSSETALNHHRDGSGTAALIEILAHKLETSFFVIHKGLNRTTTN
jgi:hypothetical protein